MNKRQRSKRARFLTRLRKRGYMRRTTFYIGIDWAGEAPYSSSYTTTSILVIGRQLGKHPPFPLRVSMANEPIPEEI